MEVSPGSGSSSLSLGLCFVACSEGASRVTGWGRHNLKLRVRGVAGGKENDGARTRGLAEAVG